MAKSLQEMWTGLPTWMRAIGILGVLCFAIAIWNAVTESPMPVVSVESVYATPPSEFKRQFADMCRERVRIDRMVGSTNELIMESRTPSPQRPTISEALAQSDQEELAAKFLAVLSASREDRLRAEPCSWHDDLGLNLVYADEPFDVYDEVVYLLLAAGSGWEDIGTTEAEARALLLKDVRCQLTESWNIDNRGVKRLIFLKARRHDLDPVELRIGPAEYAGCRSSS